jgi:hypothetical protein
MGKAQAAAIPRHKESAPQGGPDGIGIHANRGVAPFLAPDQVGYDDVLLAGVVGLILHGDRGAIPEEHRRGDSRGDRQTGFWLEVAPRGAQRLLLAPLRVWLPAGSRQPRS